VLVNALLAHFVTGGAPRLVFRGMSLFGLPGICAGGNQNNSVRDCMDHNNLHFNMTNGIAQTLKSFV